MKVHLVLVRVEHANNLHKSVQMRRAAFLPLLGKSKRCHCTKHATAPLWRPRHKVPAKQVLEDRHDEAVKVARLSDRI